MFYRYIQLFVVIASSILGLICTDIMLPSLPHIAVYFAVSANDVKMLISMFLLGQFITVLPWGMVADHIGRRPTLLLGMLILLLGSILSLYAQSIEMLLVARFLQGAGAIVAPVAGWALIQDLFPKDEGARILAWVGTLTAILPLLAPALGGILDVTYGWRSTFYCITAYAVMLCILLSVLPNKTNTMASTPVLTQKRWVIYAQIMRNKTFVSYIALFGLLNCGEWCFLTVVPFYYEQQHIAADSVGLLLMYTSMGFVCGSLLASKFFKLFGIDNTIKYGIYIALGSSSLLLLGEWCHWTSYSLFNAFSLSLYIASSALLWGGTTSRALQCYEESRGAASAVRSLILLCFSSFGAYFGRFLPSTTLYPIGLFLLFLSLCALLVFNNKELQSTMSREMLVD